ncbi:MAG: hypothetical protein FWD57_08500 [Polyangiaceae bacterium]|nr:hypothetical protein [Polyangiaceae bacterium]
MSSLNPHPVNLHLVNSNRRYSFLSAIVVAVLVTSVFVVSPQTSGCSRDQPQQEGVSASATLVPSIPVIPPPLGESPFAYAPPKVSESPTPDAAQSVAKPMDWKNGQKPERTAAALNKSGIALFQAITSDDPSKARQFFFPEEPFTPLKDIKEPNRYWKQLYRVYEQDIHKLHRSRKNWSEAVFESIEPGSVPTWVPPGDEVNKIGYFRSWGTKLRYRVDGKLYTIKIHTVISWQGEWYITHLLPWKK